jgi:hypothetical protein
MSVSESTESKVTEIEQAIARVNVLRAGANPRFDESDCELVLRSKERDHS